ncbi:MAG: type I methionyl aminopeptidase [bacterium]
MITLKTKEDIAILREGGKRHAHILAALAAMVKPGITTKELDDAAAKMIADGGDTSPFLGYKPRGAKRAYPATLCVSVNDEVVHGIPNENNRTLNEGDIVSLDLGLTHKGLITDMAITVPVGEVSREAAELLRTTERALMAGIDAAQAGKRVTDVSTAIERVGRASRGGTGPEAGHGYGIVEELSGHGVGYKVHEDPFVPNYVKGNQKGEILTPGLVIAIEPMFNLGTKDVTLDADGYTIRTADGSMSAHFEHTVVITKSGAEILTAL